MHHVTVPFPISMILEAVRNEDRRQLYRLTALGGNVDDKLPNGRTALMAAIDMDSPLVPDLLSLGADVNHVDCWGTSVLHLAVGRGAVKTVISLLNRGCNFNVKDAMGRTPLISAFHTGHEGIIRLLLRFGARAERWGGLIIAINHRNPTLVGLAISAGANVNQGAKTCLSPLNHAIKMGNLDIIRMLLQSGARVQVPGGVSFPLVNAIKTGNPDIVKLLLKYGACVNRPPCNVVALASQLGHHDVVELLVAC